MRTTYFGLQFIEEFPQSIQYEKERSPQNVSVKENGLKLFSILKILFPMLSESQTFSKLYMRSEIKYKSSYIKYLKFCENNGFFERNTGVFTITDKGRDLLNMFRLPQTKSRVVKI